MKKTFRRACCWLGVFCAGLCQARTEPVYQSGGFTLVPHRDKYLAGWNEGRLRRVGYTWLAVQHRGKPLEIEGRASEYDETLTRYRERFNLVVTFPSDPPALVVNVGDANNTSFFYLVREEGERFRSEFLTQVTGGAVSVAMLDHPRTSWPEEARKEGHWEDHREGHLLLLGEDCVLDTRTLEATRFTRIYDPTPSRFVAPLGVSPDGRSVVRVGDDREDRLGIVEQDFMTDSVRWHPIDRDRMRYHELHDIDRVWLDHHFTWATDAEGHSRLALRKDFTPLPYRGRLQLGPPHSPQYDLAPANPSLLPVLAAFLVDEAGATERPFDAEAQASAMRGEKTWFNRELEVDGVTVNLSYSGNSPEHVSLWTDVSRRQDEPVLARLAELVDKQLSTGAWDSYFAGRGR